MQGVRASLVSLNHGRAMVWLISYNENHEYRALLFFFFILDCVRPSVRPSVRWSVPHDAITWTTSYVAIASRRGKKRKLITSRFHYVAIPSHLGIR
jgi:hypothetical protein